MRNKLINLLSWLQYRATATGAQYLAFGLFGLINYPCSYFFWHQIITQEYNPLSFRLAAALLCLPLIFHKQWPTYLQNFLPLYWYLTVLYCLPFFGTYMLLMNHLSNAWLMNMVLGLFLFILLVDWLMFIVLLTLGGILGWLFFIINDDRVLILSTSSLQLALYMYMYLFAIVIGVVFSRHKDKLTEARERRALEEKTLAAEQHANAEVELRQAVMVLAGSIAHDMRTPLTTVRGLGEVIGKITPSLIQSYELAKQANVLTIPDINPRQLQKLPQIPETLGNIVTEMNDYINVTLKSLTQVLAKELTPEDLMRCSADYCINNTVKRYPFDENERNLVHVNSTYLFEFMGNQVLLFRVLSNLIKNSLYQINSQGKGEIFISTCNSNGYNQIIVKDTAGGASPNTVANLFGGYKTTKKHGTGVGLAFCKLTLESFQGNIACHSVEGDYIEFVLSFPKIAVDN